MKISKNRLKILKSLHQKKFRQKYQIFIAEGHKIALESFNKSQYDILEIIATENWLEQNLEFIPQNLYACISDANEKELSQISRLKSSPEVILVLSICDDMEFNIDNQKMNCFYLDGIQDPGNMGTIIRLAEWFGFEYVIKSFSSVDFYNPKVIQASMGSFNRVPLIEMDIEDLASSWPDINIYGAEMQGEPLWSLKEPSGVFVIGNEGAGISSETLSYCKKTISIPASPSNKAESLNAAISAGIIAAFVSK